MFKKTHKPHAGMRCNTFSGHAAFCGAVALLLSACGGGGGGGGGGGTAPPLPVNTNTAPTVSVDTPVLTSKVSNLMLSATASDADGDTLTYSWTQDSGTAVTNEQGFDSATPTFDTPDGVESLEFTVSVSDGQVSRTAKVLVVVTEDLATAAFVDGDGGSDTSGDGSFDNPYATIGFALGVADNTDLYLKTLADNAAYDETAETLTVANSRSIYGGFAADWRRDVVGNQTIVTGATRSIEWFNVDQQAWVSGLNLTAVSPEGTDLSRRHVQPIFVSSGGGAISIENNTLIAEDAEPDGTVNRSAISNPIRVSDLATLLIADNLIVAGSGGNATGEGERTIGIGDDGDVGDDGTVSQTAARGGTGSEGANGGVGGIGGNGFGEDGTSGAGGALSRAGCGEGGGGGPWTSDRVARGTDGGDGCTGAIGSEGNGGGGFGDLASFGYSHARGADGGGGSTGTGGGGGGGGASNSAGVNGGGGGGGGEAGGGGIGGRGGSGGGASLGIELFNVSNVIIERNDITTANGGNGSTGGRGAAGGTGGTGGTGAAGNDLGSILGSGARGGDGGDGGNGGRGGRGGAGGGGPSIGIFVGPGLSPVIRENTLVSGDGGAGGRSLGGIARSAGRGGWSYAVIDGDLSDGATPVLTSNNVTTGAPGNDGAPSTGVGMVGELNE